jgi:tetratricopeptide (TPR) repeat protein
LYESNHNSPVYFDGTVRTLMALGQFSSVLPLVEDYLQLQQYNAEQRATQGATVRGMSEERRIDILTLKGDVLWKMGRTTQAQETWKQALSALTAYPNKRDSSYIRLALVQSSNRAFEQAIQTLQQARVDFSIPTLFSDQLSQLYGAVGNFTAGTQEILTMLRLQGAQNIARGRISAYLISERGLKETRVVLERAAEKESSNAPLQRLYSWFLREIKEYDRALEATARLDNLINAQGREIYEFAESARRDAAYMPALKAFGLLIDKGKRNSYALSALYGYARTAEAALTAAKAESAGTGSSASTAPILAVGDAPALLERYEQIVREYPTTEPALAAQYRIASVTAEYLGNYTQAIAAYKKVLEQFLSFPPHFRQAESLQSIAAQATVELGKLYVMLGNMTDAEYTYRQVISTFPSATTERDEALFHLAELEYFRCALDSARERFGRLLVNPNADIANDALEMIGLLELQDTPLGKELLCKLAQADAKARQAKTGTTAAMAVEQYLELAASVQPKSREALLGEQALLKAGKVERERKAFESAIKIFSQALERYPEGTLGDYALLFIGDCQAVLGRKDEAMQTYSALLAKYPRSVLLQEARAKIRKLRGDA